MIVAECFPGDHNRALQMAQHGVYESVIGQIVHMAWERFRIAEETLGLQETDKLHGLRWSSSWDAALFDHRTVQGAHDLLAASFRLKIQSEANLFHANRTQSDWVQPWRAYVDEQLARWANDPFIIRAIVEATQFANKPAGLAAERALDRYLREMYDLPIESLTQDEE